MLPKPQNREHERLREPWFAGTFGLARAPSRTYFGVVVGAGAGVMGTGRFVFSAGGMVSLRPLVPGAAAGLVVGDSGVDDGVVACGGVPGIPAAGEAAVIAFSNSLVFSRW